MGNPAATARRPPSNAVFGQALVASAAALLLFAGCATKPAPATAQDTTKFTLEQSDRFLVFDKSLQETVTCTGLQSRMLADGRLEVVANVRSRSDKRLPLQVNCVFKDEQGVPIGDETPWQTLTLSEFSTEAVRFSSFTPQARRYSIRVRQAR
jgi:hypothetical protein